MTPCCRLSPCIRTSSGKPSRARGGQRRRLAVKARPKAKNAWGTGRHRNSGCDLTLASRTLGVCHRITGPQPEGARRRAGICGEAPGASGGGGSLLQGQFMLHKYCPGLHSSPQVSVIVEYSPPHSKPSGHPWSCVQYSTQQISLQIPALRYSR